MRKRKKRGLKKESERPGEERRGGEKRGRVSEEIYPSALLTDRQTGWMKRAKEKEKEKERKQLLGDYAENLIALSPKFYCSNTILLYCLISVHDLLGRYVMCRLFCIK